MQRKPTRPAPVFAGNPTDTTDSARTKLTRVWQQEDNEPQPPSTERRGVVGWTKARLPTRAEVTARINERAEHLNHQKAGHPMKDVIIEWKRHRHIGHLKGRKYRVAVVTNGAWVKSAGLADLWVPRPGSTNTTTPPTTPTTATGMPTPTMETPPQTPQTSRTQ